MAKIAGVQSQAQKGKVKEEPSGPFLKFPSETADGGISAY
jgi:hypothetical protein